MKHGKKVEVYQADLDEILNGPGYGDAWLESVTRLTDVLS